MNARKSVEGLVVLAILLTLATACASAPTATPVPPTSAPTTAPMATAVPPTSAPTSAPMATAVPPTSAPTAAPVVPTPAAFPLTITDDAGRQVTIKAAPKRIVSLAPSNTEVVYALGQGALVVGVTEYCDYPPEAKQKPKVGGFSKIDLEKVVGLTPDLILATNIHVKSIVPELEKRGLVVVVVEPKNVDDVVNKITIVGKLSGATEPAAKLAAQLKSRVDAVTAQVAKAKSKPRVFYEIDKTLFTPGPGSFIDDMIVKAGGVNIAADAKGAYAQLTPEVIIARDPEIIFLGDMLFGESPDSVKARPGWANLTAVKAGRIVPLIDENLFSRPGPRTVDGLEWLARALHPDLFK
ncbi:MAG: ABC transporter substrate-binding protein [Chloroflexi bacterium]|nr:ABC transporter substrate-binding protein [Chloroflexota bacterium]